MVQQALILDNCFSIPCRFRFMTFILIVVVSPTNQFALHTDLIDRVICGVWRKVLIVFSFPALGGLSIDTWAVHPRTGASRTERKSWHDAGVTPFNAGQSGQHELGEGDSAHGDRKHISGAGAGDGGGLPRLLLLDGRRVVLQRKALQFWPRAPIDVLEHVHGDNILLRSR